MSANIDLDGLDAMLDSTLAALRRRSEPDSDVMASFETDAGGRSSPPGEVEALCQMIEQARAHGIDAGASALAFGAIEGEGGMPSRSWREDVELVAGLLSTLAATSQSIETGHGSARISTRMGWLGDTSTQLARGVTSELVAAHVSAIEASLSQSHHRLHVLAMVLSAATKITAMIATPGAAVMALPIAYKCVREVYRRWITSKQEERANVVPW